MILIQIRDFPSKWIRYSVEEIDMDDFIKNFLENNSSVEIIDTQDDKIIYRVNDEERIALIVDVITKRRINKQNYRIDREYFYKNEMICRSSFFSKGNITFWGSYAKL